MDQLPIVAIAFDAGNVLFAYSHAVAFGELSKITGFSQEKIEDALYHSKTGERYWRKYEKGRMSTEEYIKICNQLLQKAGHRGKPLNYEDFVSAFRASYTENPGLKEFIAELKEKYHILVISNINHITWMAALRRFIKLFNLFDGKLLILSFLENSRKPEQNIFKKALHKLRKHTNIDIKAEEVVFIDDRTDNLETFAKMGGKTIHYNCQIDTFEYLRDRLEQITGQP